MNIKVERMRHTVLNASEKLIALCEGLEIENLDTLLLLGEIGDFRKLGERITERVKEIKDIYNNPALIVAEALNEVAHEFGCNSGSINSAINNAFRQVAEQIMQALTED